MSFGKRLKNALKYKKTTQKQLAELLDTTPQSISQYVVGKRNPSNKMVASIADALNLGCDYTKSGEPYFYAFIDTPFTFEPDTELENVKAEKFNQEQYQDALEKALEDVTAAKTSETLKELDAKCNAFENYLNSLGYSINVISSPVTLDMDVISRHMPDWENDEKFISAETISYELIKGNEKIVLTDVEYDNLQKNIENFTEFELWKSTKQGPTTPDEAPSSNQEEPDKN